MSDGQVAMHNSRTKDEAIPTLELIAMIEQCRYEMAEAKACGKALRMALRLVGRPKWRAPHEEGEGRRQLECELRLIENRWEQWAEREDRLSMVLHQRIEDIADALPSRAERILEMRERHQRPREEAV